MFLGILEFRVNNNKTKQKKHFWKIVLQILSQICEKMPHLSTKLLLEKSAETKKTQKKHETVNNLWRILGTKQLLSVDF